jgi:hypothetical protein
MKKNIVFTKLFLDEDIQQKSLLQKKIIKIRRQIIGFPICTSSTTKKENCASTSQIYMLHGFIPNPCEIYYFMGSYYLNMVVVHYLNMEVVMCTTFICKQHK